MTIDDYRAFLYNVVAIPTQALPETSAFIQLSYDWALNIVPCELRGIGMYDFAVCCAGASFLLTYANDVPGQTWFADYRKLNGIGAPFAGFLNSSSDNGTSASWYIPDSLRNAGFQEMMWMKDQWGRQLLGILQMLGTLWGRN